MTIEFHIPIVPPTATSQGAGKRIAVIGGKPRFFKNRKADIAETDLALLCKPHAPRVPLTGPVRLEVSFTWPWLSKTPKKRRESGWIWKTTKPDCSNVIKILEDVMTRHGFWKDDAQVADLQIRKGWGEAIGIGVRVEALND